jgi:carbamoyl-phosphate synthase large subunit
MKESEVAAAARRMNVHPVYKRIDTCAAEFAALTSYMYSTYESPVGGEVECEARPSERKKVIILGGGPNRIGRESNSTIAAAMRAFRLSAQASRPS